MLRVRRLEAGARLPVVAHPGEDLGYDVFALERAELAPRATMKVRTGIAVEARDPETGAPLGLLVRDRSFDPGCDGCVRITIGTREHMQYGVQAMEESLREIEWMGDAE